MSESDLIISAIHAAGGMVKGKTTLQKWCYFASIRTDTDLQFGPHYYGPYSQTVTRLVDDLIVSDFIVEKGRRTMHDRILYTYILTEDGVSVAEEIMTRNPTFYRRVARIVKTCRRVVGNNINLLSWAAKVYYLLTSKGKEITYEEAKKIGKTFGWQLSDEEIDSGVKLLSALKFVRKTS